MAKEYIVRLVKARNKKQPERMMVYFPAAIARALYAEEYTNAKLTFDNDGIHLLPFKGGEDILKNEVVTLPDWENNGA